MLRDEEHAMSGDIMDITAVSFIVPVYRSEESLPSLCSRIDRMMMNYGNTYEIIMIEDCGGGRSWEIIARLASENPRIHGVQLARNFGQHNALLCGIRLAKHPVIVTLDDDLQHPPEEVPKLLAKLAEGYDVVYGAPEHERHTLWRNLASQITKVVLQRSMGAETARNISAFRAFRTGIRDAFAEFGGAVISVDVLLTFGANRFSMVRVRHETRLHGQSTYTVSKLMTHALNMITGFSTLPLRLASLIGLGFTLFGLLVFCFVLGRFLIQGGSVPGFPFLASIVAIFSGAQLFALGIIGEYLARMFVRMTGCPSYVVRAETGTGGKG
jgi:undecaprenyl-phosphate 4-deoxy-4-formamido-L-arabinose transferase